MTTVLIADDASDIRLLLRAILATDGDLTVVGEAVTPEEAIELARSLQPDVIVTDYSFEVAMTGIDAAPLLRAAAPAALIILFSAYDDLHEAIRSTPAIDAFVLKTEAFQLSSTIRDHLHGVPKRS